MRDELFEWDNSKAESNLRKHGVSFVAARMVFDDETANQVDDLSSSTEEDRFLVTGNVAGQLVTVSFTMRNDRVRIISARPASKREQHDYYRI
jgi:uncharacterized protein